jgi:hypothetical protein
MADRGGALRAYKFLAGDRSPFSGWRWDLPRGGRPADWVEVSGPLELCGNGVHACTPGQLPLWLGQDLWQLELDGEIMATEQVLVASRARLIAPVTAWDAGCQARFGDYCARRARELAAAYPPGGPLAGTVPALAEEVAAQAARPWVAEAGYWAAALAGQLAAGRRDGPEYDRAFAAERAVQARWLAAELRLPA